MKKEEYIQMKHICYTNRLGHSGVLESNGNETTLNMQGTLFYYNPFIHNTKFFSTL